MHQNLHKWSKCHPHNLKHKIQSLWNDFQTTQNSNNMEAIFFVITHSLDIAIA